VLHRARRRRRASAATAVLVVLGGSLVLAACKKDPEYVSVQLPADRSRPEVGVQYMGTRGGRSDAQRAQLLDDVKSLGVTWIRVGVPWDALQPDPPSSPNGGWAVDSGLARTDTVMQMAAERGLAVSVTFGRTPSWANGGQGANHLPTDLSSYTDALRFLAERYRDQVTSWEIWNEPNNPNYLTDATPADYTTLLCAAYRTLKNTVPEDTVVSGGTGGNDWEWISQMYAAGAKGCFDVLATHPYNHGLPPTAVPTSDAQWWFQNISLVRDVMIDNDDESTPVWFTEIGWSTVTDPDRQGPSADGVTLEQQAQYLVDMLAMTHNDYPYVKRVSWFNSKDEDTGKTHNDNFGLYTVDLTAKPSADALRRYLGGGS
jgi:polysaccharide biosynthesis protein PslG